MSSTRVIHRAGLATVLLLAACGGSGGTGGNAADLAESVTPESASTRPTAEPVAPSGVGVFADLGPGTNTVTVGLSDGRPLDVTVITPPGWQAGTTTPAVLALPPGDQSAAMVEAVTGRYFGDSTAAAGWVVVSPAAPALVESSDEGRFFYQDPEPLTELLDLLDGAVVPEGGRWHVAGPSNGGLSAFRFAADHPERVASLMGLPGYPASSASRTADTALIDIPVVLYVGGDDPSWQQPMEAFVASFREAGGDVSLTVRPGQSHVIGDLSADELLEVLERLRL